MQCPVAPRRADIRCRQAPMMCLWQVEEHLCEEALPSILMMIVLEEQGDRHGPPAPTGAALGQIGSG